MHGPEPYGALRRPTLAGPPRDGARGSSGPGGAPGHATSLYSMYSMYFIYLMRSDALDAAERRRAAALRRTADREVYVAAHTALRRLPRARTSRMRIRRPCAFIRQPCHQTAAPRTAVPALAGYAWARTSRCRTPGAAWPCSAFADRAGGRRHRADHPAGGVVDDVATGRCPPRSGRSWPRSRRRAAGPPSPAVGPARRHTSRARVRGSAVTVLTALLVVGAGAAPAPVPGWTADGCRLAPRADAAGRVAVVVAA